LTILVPAPWTNRLAPAAVYQRGESRFLKLALSCSLLLIVGLQISESRTSAQDKTYTVPFHSFNGVILLDGQVNRKPPVLLLDTGANNSLVDYQAAGFGALKLEALRSTGSAGAEGACAVREVKCRLNIAPGSRRVCVMDLSDASRRMGTRIDGFVGQDVLSEFASLRIDYKASTITLEEN
jgi:hypothetical protein